jgi:lysozyme family protein
MADYRQAVLKTLVNEGGYQNRVTDHANFYNGINYGTKYGITPATLFHYHPELASDPNCIRNLSEDVAVAIYSDGYWKQGYSQINDQAVAEKLFDMGVLMSVKVAVQQLQTAMTDVPHVVPDGIFGPITLAQVNQYSPGTLLPKYRVVLIQHMINIANHNPNEMEDLTGWISRANK